MCFLGVCWWLLVPTPESACLFAAIIRVFIPSACEYFLGKLPNVRIPLLRDSDPHVSRQPLGHACVHQSAHTVNTFPEYSATCSDVLLLRQPNDQETIPCFVSSCCNVLYYIASRAGPVKCFLGSKRFERLYFLSSGVKC